MSNDRAAATTLGYALNLTVATLLISGLLVVGGDLVSTERERSIETELRVVGQQLAGDLGAADRLVRSTRGSEVTVELTRHFPDEVIGSEYYLRVEWDEGDPFLVLSTNDPDVTVRVEVASETTLAPGTVQGGTIRIVYDTATDRLVVTDG